ncbi:hypothetical protein [Bacteroides sp.]|uniref:hypothetical protein n=1 Tax=Bacteroides sp. TaxID=29523 RepID=UPI00260EDEB6|nr:hypothetical protein [Bacteroides sp.]MDD3040561.1 hypothetical protein [Bacteroides sp.]
MPKIDGFLTYKRYAISENEKVRKIIKASKLTHSSSKPCLFIFDFRTGTVMCQKTRRILIDRGAFGNRMWYIFKDWFPVYDDLTGAYCGCFINDKWYDVERIDRKFSASTGVPCDKDGRDLR